MRDMPPDYAAREKIRKILEQNFLVEAGAGSGKTTALVKRMVALVSTGTVRVGEIAAITFTRKAAGELRERFQARLEASYREASGEVEKANLYEALQELDECFLGTIHSFCGSLLRERPIEARLDPDFTELEGPQETLLQNQAWENYLISMRLEQPERLVQLAEIGVSPGDLKKFYLDLCNYPEVVIQHQELSKPDLMLAREQVMELVRRAERAMPADEPPGEYDKLQKAIRRALLLSRFPNAEQDANIVELLATFDKTLTATQKKWNTTDLGKQFGEEFASLREEVIIPVLTRWREYCHYYLVEFALPAVEMYEDLRFRRSELNFGDLLQRAARMLKEFPRVREYFQGKYKCLLVDEFQDTDPIQAQILFYLTGENLAEQNWEKLVSKPGSLFVVGDPKQSIYRFRRADIDVYNLVKGLIVKSGGEVLKLTANFRSVKALGEVLNPVFQSLLPANATSYQAEFSPLDTMRVPLAGSVSGVKKLAIPAGLDKKEAIVAEDAERISRYIRWAVDGNLILSKFDEDRAEEQLAKAAYSDFLILLRYKDCMELYARALEKYGIPFNISGGSSLKESEEIRELYKLVRLLEQPDDQVLLLAVFRGLFFGLSDNELYQIKKAGGVFSIFAHCPDGLGDGLNEKYALVLGKLSEYYRWSKTYQPVVALEKIILDLGLIPYSQLAGGEKSRTAYLYQLLELLRQNELGGAARFDQMVAGFGVLLDSNIEEELNLLPSENNVVRLMNLHKAKGLEASVVFLAHPYKKVNISPSQHIQRVGQEPTGYFLVAKQEYFSTKVLGQPLAWTRYEGEEQGYCDAEEIRLLYVAATRAKNLLIISQALSDKEGKHNPWGILVSESVADEVLELPEEILTEGTPSKEQLLTGSAELQAARLTMCAWLEKGAQPSYLTTVPTELKTAAKPKVTRASGGGTAWGNVIHRVLEEVVKGTADTEAIAMLALVENGEPVERKSEVLAEIEKFQQTDIWRRIQAAEQALTEVPFALQVGPGEAMYSEISRALNLENNSLPIILNGTIDLAIKETDGWTIVDYKSDRVTTAAEIGELASYYAPQVKIYCQVWETITGNKAREGLIYFLYPGENRRAG